MIQVRTMVGQEQAALPRASASSRDTPLLASQTNSKMTIKMAIRVYRVPLGAGLDPQCLAIKAGSRKNTRSGNTLMAEDAVESAGAKAPAFTISTQPTTSLPYSPPTHNLKLA